MSIKDQEEKFKLRFKLLCEAVQKWETDTFGQCGLLKPEWFGYNCYEIRDGSSPMSGMITKSYSSSRLREYYLSYLNISDTIYLNIEDDGYLSTKNLIKLQIAKLNKYFIDDIHKLISSTHPS